MIAPTGVCTRRRGAIAPLTAFLGTFLLAMVAFAVDVSWIVLARTELQSAADAAALAGADALMDGYVQWSVATSNQQPTTLTTAQTNATKLAQTYAGYNNAGGVHGLSLASSDVQFGYTDGSGAYTSPPPAGKFPNTVKVTMRRNSTSNGSLGLFFAPVLGIRTQDLTATAAATIYGGTVNNFSWQGQNIGILPVTYDVNAWNNFLATGQAPDGSTSYASDGSTQFQVYPSVKDSGNFGQLSLDDSHAGDSTEVGWVQSGIGSAELSDLQAAKLIPLSAHNPANWDWIGDTGLKGKLCMTINDYTNKVFLIPLFTPYSTGTSPGGYAAGKGQGKGYYYNIVQFVGVRIMPTNDTNGSVIIQPAAASNAAFTFASTPVPAGSTSTTFTTFSRPKLTQ